MTTSISTGATARERLLNLARRTTTVTLPTGDVIQVRPLSLLERTRLVKSCTVDGEVDTERLVPALVIACAFDGDAPLFTEGDREAIQAMPATEVDALWTAAAELNGLAPDAVKVAEGN